MSFREFNQLPEGFLSAPVKELMGLLGGPSIIHLEGASQTPRLFVSILLHGNEHTGLYATQRWLSRYLPERKPLPRPVTLFVGNIEAARENCRMLPGQPDFNRIWAGCPSAPGRAAALVMEELRRNPPFALIDIHNNSGSNPHYACIAIPDARHVAFARLFGKISVLSPEPAASLSVAAAPICPAVTIECGVSGEESGILRAVEFLENTARLTEMPCGWPRGEAACYRSVARVIIPEGMSFAFDGERKVADIWLRNDLEKLNFRSLAPGTWLARGKSNLSVQYFTTDRSPLLEVVDGKIVIARTVTPSMFTRSPRAIEEDCLGYLMEPVTF